MVRRQLLSWLAGLPFLAVGTAKAQATSKPLKIMMKSAGGADDPTRASFAFVHGLALANAGHEVQIFLTGEAAYLMRKSTAEHVGREDAPEVTQRSVKQPGRFVPPAVESFKQARRFTAVLTIAIAK